MYKFLIIGGYQHRKEGVMKVGIFDSGMGGLSVLALAKKWLPNVDFIYYGDSKNAPYGIKTKEEVINLSIVICDLLIEKGVEAIIVACNTATSAAIKVLREKYAIPIIGMEPALKPAIEHNHGGHIAVMATPMTLRENKFQSLLKNMTTDQCVYEIPAPKIVELVESGITSGEEIDRVLESYFSKLPLDQIESVVLGCTHFLFIKSAILKLFKGDVELIDGNEGTIHQLMRKLNLSTLESNHQQDILFMNSAGQAYINKAKALFEKYEA